VEDMVTKPVASVALVVPAYNEEACLEELANRLREVFGCEEQYDFTVFLVDNGSVDGTWSLIEQISGSDERFVGIQLSRNFGTDGGLTAGLELVTQDAVVLMCADLQDPPEMIPQFLRHWEDGYANVYGVVENRIGTGVIRRTNSEFFYWLAGRLSEVDLPRNASDFRLLDRSVYEVLRRMHERGRYLRGMSAWVGFRSIGVAFDRPPRFAGESKASTKEVMKVATRGVLSNSTRPLRFITAVGLVLSIFSVGAIVILAMLWVTRGVPFAGFGTGVIRRTNSEFFYWLAGRLSEVDLPRNASDFRLLDRSVYEVLRRMHERGRYLRGMSAWVGFRSIGVAFDRPPRFAGESKASTKEVMKVATRGVLSNSTRPLRFITAVGLVLSIFSVGAIVILAMLWVTRGVPFAGFGTLVSLSLLAFGVLALMMGIMSEYVGMIYEEVKGRPNFIIKTVTGGDR
jgi:glycosyltransferase involved in cell wall biosynthesis